MMFVVENNGKLFGPFRLEQDASAYATVRFSGNIWTVRPLHIIPSSKTRVGGTGDDNEDDNDE